jgi:hypothetical protein
MSIIRPPVSPHSMSRPPEDIDGLLSAFMRSEMPHPFPALARLPEPSLRLAAPTPARGFHPGSRFALAATLAACLVGSLALSTLFPGHAPADEDSGPRISRDHRGIIRGKPFFDISPDGHKVKGWEKEKGNTVIIKIELDDMP